MKRNKRTLWLTTTVLSLSAFSFAAGFGIRSLAAVMTNDRLGGSLANRLANLPRFASAGQNATDPDLRPAELYKDVYNKLHLFYVEPLPSETKLAEGSIDQMLAALDDPNTRLLSSKEWEAVEQLAGGSLHGLGAVLTIRKYKEGDEKAPYTERNVTVVAPLPGSAAEKAGLLPGDRITHLGGQWIAPEHHSYRTLAQLEDDLDEGDGDPAPPDDPKRQITPEQQKEREQARERARRWLKSTDIRTVMELLQSGAPGEHTLTVERAGAEKPLTVKVTLADGQAEVFSARKLNAATGYARRGVVSSATAEQLAKALGEFQKDGVQNLVLDLRRSPGGSLEAAREIAGLLAPNSTLATAKERDAKRKVVEKKIAAKGGNGAAARVFKPAAFSILVDGGTAGASEILAAAFRDNLGAKLVGAQTFGDGTEQHFVELANGAAVSITHAHLLSPKGAEVEGKGLKPDAAGGPGDAGIEAAQRAFGVRRSVFGVRRSAIGVRLPTPNTEHRTPSPVGLGR